MSRRLGIALLGLAVPAPLPAQSYAERIDRRLDASGLAREGWGIAVTDLQGRLLYGRNADRLFIPASNAKLAIATTALSLLGPGFRVTTSVHATGAVDSVVRGDLVLYGRGDPSFSKRCYAVDTNRAGACDRDPFIRLRDLARQLRARGIRRVTGDLIADGTWFEGQRTHPTWDRYDLGWYFAAPVSGLAFNDNALDIRTTAGTTRGARPAVSILPDLGLATFSSTATVGAPGSARTYDIFRSADGARYWATGEVPAGTTKLEWPSVADPDRFAGLAFRAELQAAGIALGGAVRTASDSMVTLRARRTAPLAEVDSRPLADLLFPILNASQNLFAEALLKQLGRQRGDDGSWRSGLAVQRRFLIDSVRIDSTAFSLVDGSGLSSSNRVTPLAFTAMLRYLWNRPSRQIVLATLPHAGELGTLLRRFNGTPLEGRVRAKSGAIGGVNSLSGFIERPDGGLLVFSVIANHALGGARMIAAIDSVVVEIGREPGPR